MTTDTTISTTLKAELREGTGKGVARKLRQAGRLPAVVYGRDMESIHVSLDAHDTEYLFHNIPVDNTIIELAIEGEKETHQTLVREIQTHPWKAHVMHVDFLRIQMGVAVEMDVPVHLIGTPIGVRVGGGVIEQVIHDLAIRCLPSAIPESIEVDISDMDLNDVMHIADVSFAEGIEVMVAPERTICSIAQPKAEEVEPDVEEGADDEAGEAGATEEGGEGGAEG